MTSKTNKQWYSYKDMGSYYKLVNGVLMVAYSNPDGSISKVDGQVNSGEVDFELLEGEYADNNKKIKITDRLKEIVQELQNKD